MLGRFGALRNVVSVIIIPNRRIGSRRSEMILGLRPQRQKRVDFVWLRLASFGFRLFRVNKWWLVACKRIHRDHPIAFTASCF
jgi:hypothetical protein